MSASRVERGTTLQGEYELLECLGERTGLVFRAQRRRDGAAVIVRVFAGLELDGRARLIEGATRASRVRHPALAAVSACGANGDDVFVVEELIEGRTLAELCERAGIPPLARSVDIALQLCRGLESAHRHGVAHDALCPSNVLLRSAPGAENGQLQVKLVDLGVPGFARAWPPPLRSVLFMAPEQLAALRFGRSQDGANTSMNVYSLGALLYDLCTGGPPFAAASVDELGEAHALEPVMPPSRINPQIPSTLDTALLRALSKNPAQRFASMGELIEALSGLRLSTGVSGVQPVFVNSEAEPARASLRPEGATFHGNFDERPTAKTVPPPPRASAPPASAPPSSAKRSGEEITEPAFAPAAEAEDQTTRQLLPRRSVPPLGSFSSPPPLPSTSPLTPPPPPPPLPSASSIHRAGEPQVTPAASIELLRASLAPHERLLVGVRSAASQLNRALKGRDRFLPVALLLLCGLSVFVFWRASRLPLPDEHVRTTSLSAAQQADDAAVRSTARATAGRGLGQPDDQLEATARIRTARGANDDGPAAERDDSSARTDRAAQGRRASSHSGTRVERAEPARPPAPTTADAVRALRNDISAASVAASESAPSAARDASAREQLGTDSDRVPASASDRPAEPHRLETGASHATVAEPPARETAAQSRAAVQQPSGVGQRTTTTQPARPARAHIGAVTVRGSLPSSNVAQGIDRIVEQLNGCYRAASAVGERAAMLSLLVALELDEQGRARNPRVSGPGSPELHACVRAAAGRIASRRAPDTGTVAASFQLVFAP